MSGRSLKRRLEYLELPRGGYRGPVPRFPMPDVLERELEVWRECWRTPQASAWAGESWRWPWVAMYVRWSVRSEDPASSAAVAQLAVRLQVMIGLTAGGLLDNGWVIARVTETTPEVTRPTLLRSPAGPSARDRMRARGVEAGG